MWIDNRSKNIPVANFLRLVMQRFAIPNRRALGVFLNINETYISKYVNGICKPSYGTCLKMKELLASHGMDVDVYDIRPRE